MHCLTVETVGVHCNQTALHQTTLVCINHERAVWQQCTDQNASLLAFSVSFDTGKFFMCATLWTVSTLHDASCCECRLLTMPSGERIQFANNVNFIFECHSLQYASPPTVSRCGMLLMSNQHNDTDNMLAAWLAAQPAEQAGEFCRTAH